MHSLGALTYMHVMTHNYTPYQVLGLLQRDLDSALPEAEERCVCACAVLLAAEQDVLIKAVGWDILHTFLPFVALSPRPCAHGARQLLLRAAALCNPRELYSMVMEAFVVFKVTIRTACPELGTKGPHTPQILPL
jgi:hypothetical protein